jgi:hypothetical protein
VRVVVCGSRDWGDYRSIRDALARLAAGHPGEPVTIVHGACSRVCDGVEVSADMIADRAARELGLAVESHPADWQRYGRSAGPRRNRMMLDPRPDMVLAFQHGVSRGTADMVAEAVRRGVLVELSRHNPDP